MPAIAPYHNGWVSGQSSGWLTNGTTGLNCKYHDTECVGFGIRDDYESGIRDDYESGIRDDYESGIRDDYASLKLLYLINQRQNVRGGQSVGYSTTTLLAMDSRQPAFRGMLYRRS